MSEEVKVKVGKVVRPDAPPVSEVWVFQYYNGVRWNSIPADRRSDLNGCVENAKAERQPYRLVHIPAEGAT